MDRGYFRRTFIALGMVALAVGALPVRRALAQHGSGAAAVAGAPGDEVESQDLTEGDAGVGYFTDVPPAVQLRTLVPDGAAPVASGRGVRVSADEFYRRVADAPEPVQRAWAASPALLDEVIDRMVSDQLLVNEARRLGLDQDPVVRATLERALVARLRATVLNPAAGDGTAVTADEIAVFYTTHAQRFHIPERRRARVIFLATRREAEQVLALAAARTRRHRHDAHAAHDFRELALRYNTDPELIRTTGDIRDVTATQSDLDAGLRDAIFAIPEPNQVAPQVIAGRWNGVRGFFVVRLLARRAPIDRTLAESSDWIRQRLVLARRVAAERALVERLARDAQVTRLPAERVVRLIATDAGDGG